MGRRLLSAVSLAAGLSLLGGGSGVADDKLFVAEVRQRKELTADVPSKLSPALQATKDSGGVLKGMTGSGNPVIAVPEGNAPRLTASKAVKDAKPADEAKREWRPVKKLRISYDKNTKPTEADLKDLGLTLIEDYQKGSFMVVGLGDGGVNAKLATALEASPKVQYVAPSVPLQAIPKPEDRKANPPPKAGRPAAEPLTARASTLPADRLFPQLWGMRNARAVQAWQRVHESPEVVVAVIDTGVDYTHPDLKPNMWKSPAGKYGFDFVENDDDPMDGDSHGTHCAGTIGGRADPDGVVGVTWKVKIMALRWLDDGGFGEVENAIKCIDFAVDNGADILSNSWFWPVDVPELEAAVKRADAAGRLFVAAAANFRQRPGNNGGDNDNPSTLGRIPSAYPVRNVVAVAAIDEADGQATFSNWGKKTVHLAAPGVGVVSSVKRGRGDPGLDPSADFDSFSGTSMATPHVAGAAALTLTRLRATDPAAEPVQVKKLLLDNARKIASMTDRCTTGGTLDLTFLGRTSAPKK